MSLLQRWRHASRRTRLLLIAATAYGLYALLGWLVLSPLVRTQIVEQTVAATGRPVSLESFVFNPLTLSVRARGFVLEDPDGSEFLAFDELYANFQLSSLFRRAYHFDEIALLQPRGRVVREAGGGFNFDDLIARLSADPAETAPVPEEDGAEPGGLPPLSVARLRVEQGGLMFIDRLHGDDDVMDLGPVTVEITDFTTRTHSEDGNAYRLDVVSPGGGSFHWQGRFDLNPLVAEGHLALRGVDLVPFAGLARHQVRFRLGSGRLDIETGYRLDTSDTPHLTLHDGRLRLQDLALQDPQQDLAVVQLPALTLDDVRLDSLARQVDLGTLTLTDPAVRMRLLDSGLDLAALFTPITAPETGDTATSRVETAPESDAEPAAAETAAAEAPTAAAERPPSQETEVADTPAAPEEATADGTPASTSEAWAITLDTLQLDGGHVTFRDETLPTPAERVLTPLTLTLSDLALNDPRRFRLELEAALEQGGTLAISGDGTLVPLELALKVRAEALPLPTLQPWIATALRAEVTEGQAGADLNLQVRDGEAVRVRLNGQAQVQQLQAREGRQRLLDLERLQLNGLSVDTDSRQVQVAQLAVRGLDARARIDADGQTPVDRLLIPAATDDAPGSAPWRVQVQELRLEQSAVRYVDQSLTPHFQVALNRIEGTLKQLDTAARTPVLVDLKGRVDDYAPLSVSGRMNPLAARPSAELTTRLEGWDMTGLTPYTGRYLGYVTDTGQLTLESLLKLDGSTLDSSTRIKALRFFLGGQVDSADALKVPIKLGLAVIRDRNDLIDLPVTAAGDLSDPSVSVSGILLKALTNVLVRAATSPFSVLGGLFGGADLQQVLFSAGEGTVDEVVQPQLETLAKVLSERPNLAVTLTGEAGPADRQALTRQWLLQEVRADADSEAPLADRGVQRRLLQRFRRDLERDSDSLVAPLPEGADEAAREAHRLQQVQAALAALVAHHQERVPEDLLRNLASARAQQVKTWLMDTHQLAGDRLSLSAPQVSQDADGHRVRLALNAR